MRWEGDRASNNVEDRRGMGGVPIIGGGLGLLAILVISLLTGADPRALLQMVNSGGSSVAVEQPSSGQGASDAASRFVSVVLADTEDVWHDLFARMGRNYVEPKLVLFTGQVNSACGNASAAVGPFYCPPDQKVYIDLSFYNELKNRFGAPGDFAQAYVIAHEVGHHVQNLLGISDKVEGMQSRADREERNRLSVRLELQADFFAGVWAHHAQRMKNILEPGDLEEALHAASAIGDDNIQKQTRGYVVPDSFTHGSAAQRVRWFRKGFETGDINAGDTFGVPERDL